MASTIPDTLKKFVSAIRRAEELEKESKYESKILAYYCRLYVVSKASKSISTPEEKKFIIEQLGLLEASKSSLKINENDGQNICREQALAVFNKADEIDRMGLADKSTAKLFYAAGTFFEILDQFGDVDKDVIFLFSSFRSKSFIKIQYLFLDSRKKDLCQMEGHRYYQCYQ